MILRMVLPSVCSSTFGLCSASDLTISSSASLATVRRSRSLPFTCTTISISLRTNATGSYVGHAVSERREERRPVIAATRSWISSVRCGAKGFKTVRNWMNSLSGTTSAWVKALVQIIICEIAVLKLSLSMSSPVFLIVSCTKRSSSLSVHSVSLILAET